MGADDYISKPFNTQEMIARVKAQLRRYMRLGAMNSESMQDSIRIGDLYLDKHAKELNVNGESNIILNVDNSYKAPVISVKDQPPDDPKTFDAVFMPIPEAIAELLRIIRSREKSPNAPYENESEVLNTPDTAII